MRKMKKFFAALLTFVMVLGMTTTAFAAQADLTNHTFTAYQIFTADSITTDGELGNLAWGSGISEAGQTAILNKYITAEGVEKNVENLVKVIGAMENDSAAAKEFAQFAYQYVTGAGTAVTSEETKLPLGYYLIKDTTTEKVDVYNLSVLKVSDNTTAVTITNKTEVPSSDKKIVEGENKVTTNEAAIGDVVNYEITGTLPSNLAEYETYYVRFNDTLSAGLTYKNDAQVYIGTENVTKYFYVGSKAVDNGTAITVSIADILLLDKLDNVTINANTVITVKYSATLNENAVIAGEGNPNDVTMDYSNNPDKSGYGTEKPNTPPENPDNPQPEYPTGTTPEKEVKTYVTELTILKTDENGDILTGAEFQLTGDGVNKIVIKTDEAFVEDAAGTYYKLADGTFTTTPPTVADDETDNTDAYDAAALEAGTMFKKTVTTSVVQTGTDVNAKAFVGADGKVTFTGLGVGSYTITETTTPTGYNTVAPVNFTVTFDAATGKFDATGVTLEDDNTLSTTIVNKKGTTLPETGGIGTKIFYVFGSVLVVVAGILLITKKRMSVR